MDNQVLLRPEDVARSCALSRTRVYQLLRSGELPSVRVGRSRRVTPQALADFVQKMSNGVVQP